MSFATFIKMGGYAFEVWTSWGLTLLVLLAFVVIPKYRNIKIRRDIKRQIDRESRTNQAKQ